MSHAALMNDYKRAQTIRDSCKVGVTYNYTNYNKIVYSLVLIILIRPAPIFAVHSFASRDCEGARRSSP